MLRRYLRKTEGGGLSEYSQSGAPGAKFEWPKNSNGIPAQGYQVAVENYWKEAVTSVEIEVKMTLSEVIKHGTDARSGKVTLSRSWLIPIRKIDPGLNHAFTFYVINKTDQFASVKLPDTATVQTLGSDQKQTVELQHVIWGMGFAGRVESLVTPWRRPDSDVAL
jgi:hypothetical protein